jgi:hypothetical protein
MQLNYYLVQRMIKMDLSHIDRGALHRELRINPVSKIPVSILHCIMKTRIPSDSDHVEVKNPSKTGSKYIRVTRDLKAQASLAINMRDWKERKSKKRAKKR